MEPAKLEELRQRLAELRRQTAELKQQAGDIPAFQRNTARIEASINMMAIALGESVLDPAWSGRAGSGQEATDASA